MTWTSCLALGLLVACSPAVAPVPVEVATPIANSSHVVVTTSPTDTHLRIVVTRWQRCGVTVPNQPSVRCRARPAVGKPVVVVVADATVWSATTDATGTALAPWQPLAVALYTRLGSGVRVDAGRDAEQVSAAVAVAGSRGLGKALAARAKDELEAIIDGAWTDADLKTARRLLALWAQWLPNDATRAAVATRVDAITRQADATLAHSLVARCKTPTAALASGFALTLIDSSAALAAVAKRSSGAATVVAAMRELDGLRTAAVERIVASAAGMRAPADQPTRRRLIAEAALLAPADARVQTLLAEVRRAAPVWMLRLDVDAQGRVSAEGTARPGTHPTIRMRWNCKTDHGSSSSSAIVLRRTTPTSTSWRAQGQLWALLRPALACELVFEAARHAQHFCWRNKVAAAAPCPAAD